MKENPVIELFNRILQKYDLVKPVPRDVQRHIRQIKKKQFRKTLKKAGVISMLFIFISHIFFSLRRFGFNVTMLQSAVLAGVISAILAVSITSGAYLFATGQLSRHPEKKEERSVEIIEKKKTPGLNPEQTTRVPVETVPGAIKGAADRPDDSPA